MFLFLEDHFSAIKNENVIVNILADPDKYHKSEVAIMPKFAKEIKTINT